MKRRMRIIQINGVRGIFIMLFVVSCLIAGFIAFPGFLFMHAWNYLFEHSSAINKIGFAGGMLLWGITAVSCFLFSRKKFIVSFNAKQELSEPEIKEVVEKIKEQVLNSKILPNDNLKCENEISEEKELTKLNKK